jgi:predicted SAM-dependent methyltransferase
VSDSVVNSIGASIRRVPGGRVLLDARIALRARRVELAERVRDKRLEPRERAFLTSLTPQDDVRVNIGAGSAPTEGWLNTDLFRSPDRVKLDATRRWPFADEVLAAINIEHMVEHLERDQLPPLLAEAHRTLRPGGLIRISTPDLEGLSHAYREADPAVLEAHRGHGYTARNHADLVNNYSQLFGHRHIYDFATLELLLREAGFEQIERQDFGESRHPELRGIDRHDVGPTLRPLVVTVDAVKPG